MIIRMIISSKYINVFIRSINRNYSTATESFKFHMMSGIQPSGFPHIGNYLGALQQWKLLQDTKKYDKLFFSIVDLHSLTSLPRPDHMRQFITDTMASLIACGLNQPNTIIFQQSMVPQHSELCWILTCLTTMNKLEHLPQWKEKKNDNEETLMGLFNYPILQAADILLYKATDVPVGEDQLKHIELTRHLAKKFNKTFNNIFPLPKPILSEFVRIRSLREPLKKMSKSAQDSRGRIELVDTPDEIRSKIRKSISDMEGGSVTYDPEKRCGVSNLIEIHSAFTGLTFDEICEDALHLDTSEYKERVAEVVIEALNPIRGEIVRLKNDQKYLRDALAEGCNSATLVAEETMVGVRDAIGVR